MVIPKHVEALDLARKIAIYNAEAIFYIKNSLKLMDGPISKRLENMNEKYRILIQSSFPSVDYSLILANHDNNHNHNLTKLDVDLIKDVLLEDFENA